MKKAIVLLGLLLCLLPLRPAQAVYITTADLELGCLSHQKEKIAGCLHYIAGVIDYHVLMQSLGTTPTIDFCLPENLSLEDAAVAVMQYLREHPQHDAFIASAAVPLALNQAYPCRPPPPPGHRKKHRRAASQP